MKPTEKKWPQVNLAGRQPGRTAATARPLKPAVAQSKSAAGVRRQPVAPAAYRPQPQRPPVAQAKAAAPTQKRVGPVAPPVYRPQLTPKVLQAKTASAAAQRGAAAGPRAAAKLPTAPPVYRPQSVSKAPQPKTVNVRQVPRQSAPTVQLKAQAPAIQSRPGNVIQPMKYTYRGGEWKPFSKPAKDWKGKYPPPVHDVQEGDTYDDETGDHKRGGKLVVVKPAAASASASTVAPTTMGASSATTTETKKKAVNVMCELGPKLTSKALVDKVYTDFRSPDHLTTALGKNHYYLHDFAEAALLTPARAGKPIKVLNLDKSRVPEKGMAEIKGWVSKATPRPADCVHRDDAGNLPAFKDSTPYVEFHTSGGDGVRIVVDANTGLVYLSWHYGDGQLAKSADSPFLLLYEDGAPMESTITETAKKQYQTNREHLAMSEHKIEVKTVKPLSTRTGKYYSAQEVRTAFGVESPATLIVSGIYTDDRSVSHRFLGYSPAFGYKFTPVKKT